VYQHAEWLNCHNTVFSKLTAETLPLTRTLERRVSTASQCLQALLLDMSMWTVFCLQRVWTVLCLQQLPHGALAIAYAGIIHGSMHSVWATFTDHEQQLASAVLGLGQLATDTIR
jgi:hypothetical protein